MNKIARVSAAVATVGVLGLSLTACSEDRTMSVPQSFCGFLQGKGGRDDNNKANSAALKQVLYEGQTVDYKDDQDIGLYFPCVTRNYVVAPDNAPSKDTSIPLEGLVDGTPVHVWVTMYWQPNQSPEAIRDFISFAQGKYGAPAGDPSAFNGRDEAGNMNATEGWNKMLAENWWITLQRVVSEPLLQASPVLWQVNDQAERDKLGQAMSDAFAEKFQMVTGKVNDLICGPSSSGGGDSFNCEPVVIAVDRVNAVNQQTQQSAANAKATEDQLALDQKTRQADIDATNAKYGDLGPAFRACRDLNVASPGTCKLFPGAEVQVPVAP